MFFFHVNTSKGHKASVLSYTLPLFAIINHKEIMEFMHLDMLTEGTHSRVLFIFKVRLHGIFKLEPSELYVTGISHVYVFIII